MRKSTVVALPEMIETGAEGRRRPLNRTEMMIFAGTCKKLELRPKQRSCGWAPVRINIENSWSVEALT